MPRTSREFRSATVPVRDGHYCYYRHPGFSARSVRWAFYDPEPKPAKEESRFKTAMVALKEVIPPTRKSDSQQGVYAAREAEGPTFDELPLELKSVIFNIVQSTPSWIHLTLKRGRLVKFEGANQEIYVNKEWHQSSELRQGLSRIDPNIASKGIMRAFAKRLFRSSTSREKNDPDIPEEVISGDPPYPIVLKHKIRTPRVRREVDWFFFDSILDKRGRRRVWPICHHFDFIHITHCVFRLDHVYEMIYCEPLRENPFPYFIWSRMSHIEELVILVGEFRKEVPPSNMKHIRAFWVEELREEINKLKIDYGQDVSDSDNYMMGYITEFWASAFLTKRRQRNEWLDSDDGKRWLAYEVHDEDNRISTWLACPEGYKWLDSHGSEFLASESGRWWLASDLGYPWLETEKGTQWLGSEGGREFLDSPQALLWANTSTYEPSQLTPLGRQVRKNWFKTPAGREWEFSHCPDGNPPDPPQRPQRESNPPPDERIAFCFTNINFRGWRYVICPHEGDAPEREPRLLAAYTAREIIRK
ncbi:hypothetical protein F5Y06DRAFT_302681 [Hypoxylon sp. FL0890]|nr:hypothetical protein F5Y06DRAFT_302681 [Hypoxylon sp. FL0890]